MQANGRVTFFTRKGETFPCRQKFRFQALPQYLNIAAALQSLDLRLHGNDDPPINTASALSILHMHRYFVAVFVGGVVGAPHFRIDSMRLFVAVAGLIGFDAARTAFVVAPEMGI